jgi:hypothetical protein
MGVKLCRGSEVVIEKNNEKVGVSITPHKVSNQASIVGYLGEVQNRDCRRHSRTNQQQGSGGEDESTISAVYDAEGEGIRYPELGKRGVRGAWTTCNRRE